jgi:hypothetical protein
MWFTIGFTAACGLCVYLLPDYLWIPLVPILLIAAGIFGLKRKLPQAAVALMGAAAGLIWFVLFQRYYLLPALSLASAFVSQFFINRRFFAFMGVSLIVLLITGTLQMLKTLAADAFSVDMISVTVVQALWSLPFSALTYFMPARWSRERIG